MTKAKNALLPPSDLIQARKIAGGLLQSVMVFPSFLHLAMAMGASTFRYVDLIKVPRNHDELFVMLALWGAPTVGFAVGQLIKHGVVWA